MYLDHVGACHWCVRAISCPPRASGLPFSNSNPLAAKNTPSCPASVGHHDDSHDLLLLPMVATEFSWCNEGRKNSSRYNSVKSSYKRDTICDVLLLPSIRNFLYFLCFLNVCTAFFFLLLKKSVFSGQPIVWHSKIMIWSTFSLNYVIVCDKINGIIAFILDIKHFPIIINFWHSEYNRIRGSKLVIA